MVNFGNIEIADLRLGATQVKALYLGSQQVWGGEEPVPTAEPLCFTAEEANSTVALSAVGSAPVISLECSTDGSTWSPFVVGTTTVTLANVGDKVYVRAASAGNTGMGTSSSNYNMFVMTGKIAASGNVDTLLDQNGNATLTSYCYIHMFDGCASLTTAPELPATTLAERCYQHMFYNCTSLTTAPALPATTLANYCYFRMFQNCTSLTTAPALPATTLADQCYGSMFDGCASLTTAPELHAMTLANTCYQSMFQNCTALTTAPELPAMTLANLCYQSMFQNCTALTTAPELPATTLQWGCYNNMFRNCTSLSSVEVAFTEWTSGTTNFWLDNVAASGTFTCPAELPDQRGANKIPVGWNVVHPAAEPLCFTAEQANSTVRLDKSSSSLSSVSLETSYDGSNWSDYSWSGSTGSTLTLANVGDKVYMRAKTENQTISNSSDYYQFVMTGKIAASGNIQTLLKADGSRTDAPAYCYSSMFSDCSSLTTPPALPATTLAEGCYLEMFYNCSSLTTAPTLPATTLADYCYSGMFSECWTLSQVAVSFTEWDMMTDATNDWVSGVAASGTFTCPAELPDERGNSSIPVTWRRVDAT